MIRENPPAQRVGHKIQLRDVSISAGHRPLLQHVNAEFPVGGVTLIVGPSGVGKSLLLRAIAGIEADAEVHRSGQIMIDGAPARPGKVGVVFQDFALFEELSPRGNIRFAQAHGKQRGDTPRTAEQWMEELAIPRHTRTRNLSGGQRQRLAIARALAANPDALLYDEPTSGLDPLTADRVAQLISQTASEHQQTTVIVTHDYRSLVPIAEAIFVLDPDEMTLVPIERERWGDLGEILAGPGSSGRRHDAVRPKTWAKVGRRINRFLAGTTRAAEEIAMFPLTMMPLWRSAKWGGYYFSHYLRLVAGPSAWLYLAVAGIIIGFVTTYFTFRYLPYAAYTEPLLIDDLLGSMGFALFRIFTPVLATLLIAARCGAAVASDVGGKRYGRQMEAYQSLHVRPRRYLLTGTLYAFLIGTPLLVAIGYITACLTSMVVFTWVHPELGPDYWRLHFHRELSVAGTMWFVGSGWWFAKMLTCAVGIAMIAYHTGATQKSSPSDVSRSVTATILWTTLFVLAVHFVYAFFEFTARGAT